MIHCTWPEDQGVWPPRRVVRLQPTPQLSLEAYTHASSHTPAKTPEPYRCCDNLNSMIHIKLESLRSARPGSLCYERYQLWLPYWFDGADAP